jgi:ubiquinone/menaquinone biosynthesis C-methylase UbiE
MNCDIRIDIKDMNFEDNFFDVIICNHVLEHIVDDRKAMREFFRVLRPEGFVILQVPISKNAK